MFSQVRQVIECGKLKGNVIANTPRIPFTHISHIHTPSWQFPLLTNKVLTQE